MRYKEASNFPLLTDKGPPITPARRPQAWLEGPSVRGLHWAPEPSASCSTRAVAACYLSAPLDQTVRGWVLDSVSPAFSMCQAQAPKPGWKQARVNTEGNKGWAEAQLCAFTAELMSTPSYISASPAPLSGRWRRAGCLSSCAVLAGEHATLPQLCHSRY